VQRVDEHELSLCLAFHRNLRQGKTGREVTVVLNYVKLSFFQHRFLVDLQGMLASPCYKTLKSTTTHA